MKHWVIFVVMLLFWTTPLFAVKIALKDGRTLEGRTATLSKVDEKADEAGKNLIKFIVVLDDGLRRIYFPKYNMQEVPELTGEQLETFRTNLRFNRGGQRIDVLGEYDNTVPFDVFGRRILPLRHFGGTDLVVQVITELTPKYIRVRALQSNKSPIEWDMRMATNSIPRNILTPILLNQIDPKNVEDRKRLVRFYIQGNLYEDAVDELDDILKEHADDPDVKEQLAGVYRTLKQRRYQRRLEELELRWKAGQFATVKKYVAELEKDENLPDQLFQAVSRMMLRYDDFEKKRTETAATLRSLYEKLPADEKNAKIPPILDDIEKGLTLNTVDRLATFRLFAKSKEFRESEKLAIAITGWFAGPTADNKRLTVAVTLPETRDLVVNYLRTEKRDSAKRQEILATLKTMESGRPDLVAGIVAQIDPPKESPPSDPERPGYYQFEIDNPIERTVPQLKYSVQLPPEYDPKRRYPMIVTLNGLSQTPDRQLDWWAGPWKGTERYGQAGRLGYIVIAPEWNPTMLLQYDYSGLAHAAVLYATKDAFRRFSVDTDRVFLTGHGIGGTAAWDIGISHPDLWAGVVPFNAVAGKYINAYFANARYVPLYFVAGELEGVDNIPTFPANADIFNRYLARQINPYDATVVRYIGRGMENFSDEILNIFEWMRLHPRVAVPQEFETNALRNWDNFFWGIELDNLERDFPDCVCDPLNWPEKGAPKKMIGVKSQILKTTNGMRIAVTPVGKSPNPVVFLTPDMIKFDAKSEILVNNKPYHPKNGFVEPDVGVILEDARTRSDRLRPFWVRLDGKNR